MVWGNSASHTVLRNATRQTTLVSQVCTSVITSDFCSFCRISCKSIRTMMTNWLHHKTGNALEIKCPEISFFFFFFLVALALLCCTRGFSSCGERGLLFIAVHGLLMAVASLVAEFRFWSGKPSVVVVHRHSCSAACGIYLDQGSNTCPLHWQVNSHPLYHQESPRSFLLVRKLTKYDSPPVILEPALVPQWATVN